MKGKLHCILEELINNIVFRTSKEAFNNILDEALGVVFHGVNGLIQAGPNILEHIFFQIFQEGCISSLFAMVQQLLRV